jgi:hypothetical protein
MWLHISIPWELVMNTHRPWSLQLGFALVFVALAGCDRAPASNNDAERVAAMEKRIARLETDVAALHSGTLNQPSASARETSAKPSGDARNAGTAAPSGAAGPVVASGSSIQPVVNPELKGTMGRIVVKFPEGSKTQSTHIVVQPAGGEKPQSGAGYGDYTLDLLPGSYDVIISGAAVTAVQVKSKHDTSIPVGVLRTSAGANTNINIMTEDGKTQLHSLYGSNETGLPAAKYQVNVAAQSMPVEIKSGQTTEF